MWRYAAGMRTCSRVWGTMVFENENHPEIRSTHRTLPPERSDRTHVAFDDHRLVANAGLLLPATLAHHQGLGALMDRHVDLGEASGRANAGGEAPLRRATRLEPSPVTNATTVGESGRDTPCRPRRSNVGVNKCGRGHGLPPAPGTARRDRAASRCSGEISRWKAF